MSNNIEMSKFLLRSNSFNIHDNILLCFPHAGVGSSFYRTWLEKDHNLAILPIQLPGREDRIKENTYISMDNLLDDLFSSLPDLSKKKTYLFGHSMGAFIALACAKRLEEQGYQPAHLFVSGAIAPQYRDPNRKLYNLDRKNFWEKILSLGGIPDEIALDTDLLLMMEERLRADLNLCENWSVQFSQKFLFGISVLYGDKDGLLTKEGLEGWQELTIRRVLYHSFSGGHFYLKNDMVEVLDIILEHTRRI